MQILRRMWYIVKDKTHHFPIKSESPACRRLERQRLTGRALAAGKRGGEDMDNNQENTNTTPSQSSGQGKSGMNLFIPIAIVGLIVIVLVGIFAFQGQQKESPSVVKETEQTPTNAGNSTETPTIVSQATDYKDGTYKAIGNYTSPGGAEQIDVSVTIKDDIIENAEVKSIAQRPNTIKFQGIFVANYEPFVVGKNIDEVKLDKVSASSLAPKGFNDALEKIKAEAKA